MADIHTYDRVTFGRKVIYTDVDRIDASNILEVLDSAMQIHSENRSDIQYLYNVYLGKMDILLKTKEVRPEINNKIVVNYPYRIVRFKAGYEFGDPIQYVSRQSKEKGSIEEESEAIRTLNRYMLAEEKQTCDISLGNWTYIAGTGYRIALQDDVADEDEAPFEIEALDPRFTFVVYSRKIGHRQMMCGTFYEDDFGQPTYSLYTDTESFTIKNGSIYEVKPYVAVSQPIIEYYFNDARMGAFEPVLSLCNAINRTVSGQLDGLEQLVQALAVFKNVNIDAEDFDALRDKGAILVPSDGDVKYLIQDIDQVNVQTLVNSAYRQILEITGLPNRDNSYSGDDTGKAVIYKNGWSDAEAYAKNDEMMFKKSETRFLKLIIDICNTLRGTGLKIGDIEINFTRRNYENIAAKAEVLMAMLGTPKIHPRLAFEHSGLFPDPENAYAISMQYEEEQEKKALEQMELEAQATMQPTTKVDINDGEGGSGVAQRPGSNQQRNMWGQFT